MNMALVSPEHKTSKPVSRHIDEILRHDVPRSQWIELGQRLFADLIHDFELLDQQSIFLIIPLRPSEKPDPPIARFDELREIHLHDLEPPSLYLVEGSAFELDGPADDHWSPITPPINSDKSVVFRFRAFRFLNEIHLDQLYYQAIYGQYTEAT